MKEELETPAMRLVLQELEAMEKIARALDPLTPRMRAAVLRLVFEHLEDQSDRRPEGK